MAVFYGRQGPDGIPPELVAAEAAGEMDAVNQISAADFAKAMNHPEIIGKEELAKAIETLTRYKSGKANLESRIVEDELWWEMRHWDAIRGNQRSREKERFGPEPTSGWLFNAIVGKHADAMDNYPEPMVLPRERSDEDSAKTLSEILPVILETNDFKKVYSDAWWEKLKHGTAAYAVVWNKDKENVGDVDIRQVDLLKIFWEPGITDIQSSRNLFIVDLVDEDILDDMYPENKGKLKGGAIDVKQYVYDDTVDTSEKALVVDWYYKKRTSTGKTVVHYAKFVGDILLYASENDPNAYESGIYDSGKYPVVFDVLYPEKGTPCGFGYVAICKDPQMYIDKLSANILEGSLMGSKKRYFVSSSTNVNKEQFLDWNEPLVEVEGELSDMRLQEIAVNPTSDVYLNVAQWKVEEMKDTASNKDVSNGSASSGVTSGAAISALQEAGNRTSRDMISQSYTAYSEIAKMVVELIRQFYDTTRSFRITAPNGMGGYDFVEMSNEFIRDQPTGYDASGEMMFRRPVFDLKISAQKTNPFSRMEQNERAKELYSLGFFNPDNAQQALTALDMMDFEGIEKMKEKISEGQTLTNVVQQLQEQVLQLASIIQGQPVPGPMEAEETPDGAPETNGKPMTGGGVDAQITRSAKPQTSYAQKLASRAPVSMENSDGGATPR